MKTSITGRSLIQGFEGTVLHVYKDIKGLPTIGTGHLIKPGESFTTITQQQADDLLSKDLARFEIGVSDLVRVPLTQNQFDALVSFSFNLGLGALAGSTLLKKLNLKDYKGAALEMLKWDHVGSVKVPGLTSRRIAEMNLFNK